MESSDCDMPGRTLAHPPAHPPDSLFEGCSWFYALCREYLFRDHTQEIARALFSPVGPAPGTHVLELGCGPGFYACRLSQEYPQIHTTGVDLSERLIARAKSRAASRSLENCTFAHCDVHALRDPSNSIDAIVVSRLFLIVQTRHAPPQPAPPLSSTPRPPPPPEPANAPSPPCQSPPPPPKPNPASLHPSLSINPQPSTSASFATPQTTSPPSPQHPATPPASSPT